MRPETIDNDADLRTYARVLWRWKLLFLACLIAVPVAVYLVERGKPKIYASSTLVELQSAPGGGTDANSPPQQAATVARLISTTGVARDAAQFLKPPPADPNSLLGGVSATVDNTTGFLTITDQDRSPVRAAQVANAFASALNVQQNAQAVAGINGQIGAVAAQLNSLPPKDVLDRNPLSLQIARLRALRTAQGQGAVVLEPATPNGAPVSPHVRRDVELALVIGLLLGIGAVLVAERSDRRLRSADDVEAMTGLALLSTIPRSAFSAIGKPEGRVEEAFQMLRAALTYFNVDRRLRSVAVASAGGEDGKTTVAMGLAHAAAVAGRRAILLDADMRRPQVAQRLGESPRHGLGAVLAGERRLEDVMIDVPVDEPDAGRLSVIPAGPPVPNPAALVASAEMSRLIRELEERADLVVVDTPAALAVSDALPLIGLTSGVIVVVRLNRTTRSTVRRVKTIVASARGTLLGAVVTGARPEEGYGYGYDYYTKDGKGGRRRPFSLRRRRKGTPGSYPLGEDSSLPASPPVPAELGSER